MDVTTKRRTEIKIRNSCSPPEAVSGYFCPPLPSRHHSAQHHSAILFRPSVIVLPPNHSANLLRPVMTRYDFDQLLGRRKVVRHYTATDLTEDLEYAERR